MKTARGRSADFAAPALERAGARTAALSIVARDTTGLGAAGGSSACIPTMAPSAPATAEAKSHAA